MDNQEIWKPIRGYEGYYEVSNLGNVRSLSENRKKSSNKPACRVLKKALNRFNGYYSVMLCVNGKTKRYYVHRLVAEAFLMNPNNLGVVNHKNENKADNRADNLEWCDIVYNHNYGTGEKRRFLSASINKKGKCYPKRILQFSPEGNYIASYPSSEEAARAIGHPFAGSNIRICARRQDGKRISFGYLWRYEENPSLIASSIF